MLSLNLLMLLAFHLATISAHFFAGHGVQDVQDFILEQRLNTIFGTTQNAKQICDMDQGPYCNGIELGNSVSKQVEMQKMQKKI